MSFHNFAALKKNCHVNQLVLCCKCCRWTWNPFSSIIKNNLRSHFEGANHILKKKKAADCTTRDVTITEAFNKTKNLVELKVVEALLLSGVSCGGLQKLLTVLAGTTLPQKPPNIAKLVQRHERALTNSSLDTVTKILNSQSYLSRFRHP